MLVLELEKWEDLQMERWMDLCKASDQLGAPTVAREGWRAAGCPMDQTGPYFVSRHTLLNFLNKCKDTSHKLRRIAENALFPVFVPRESTRGFLSPDFDLVTPRS